MAKVFYREGRDGLDIAEMWITSVVAALIEVQNARATNPAAHPMFGPEATPHVAARRIIARLLDAGWRPADPECLDRPVRPEGEAS